MQIKTRFFCISLLFLTLFALPASAQKFFVETRLDSIVFCPDASQAVPVKVKNVIGVDSFNLVLEYDPEVISFQSYFGLHQELQLNGGIFSLSEQTGSVVINWHRPTACNLFEDTLVMLIFKGHSGECLLSWDTVTPGNCIYHSIGDTLVSSVFTNGHARVNPPMTILLSEIDPTCVGSCDANYMVNVEGGTKPYTILWNNEPGRFDSIQSYLCDGPNSIRIIDHKGCELDSIYQIEGLPGPDATLKIECENDTTTVLYRENPILTFTIETTDAIKPPMTWEFGDGDTAVTTENTVTHLYGRANTNLDNFYQLKLHLTNENDCDTVITVRIPIKDQELKISNVIIPNGSPENRVFTIFNESAKPLDNEYVRFEVYIFDRWGRRLYSNSDYQNDWEPVGAPDGVYYYVVKSIGFFSTNKHKGSVTILGGN